MPLYLRELPIEFASAELEQFCQRWQVQELYLFGSVLREDFHTGSDIDVMISFQPTARWGFEIAQMKAELEHLFKRRVDLLTKPSIEQSHNWIRRQDILSSARLIYAA